MTLSSLLDVLPVLLPAIAGPVLYIAFFYLLDEVCHSAWAYRRAARPPRALRARPARTSPLRLTSAVYPPASRNAALTPGR